MFLLTAMIYTIIGRKHGIIIINQKVNIRIQCVGKKNWVVFNVFTRTGTIFQMYLSMVKLFLQLAFNGLIYKNAC